MSDKTNNNLIIRTYSKLFGSTFGHIAFASFFIAAVSGVLLAIPFDVNTPFNSIAEMLIANPAAEFIRSVHYWSAQFFLIFMALHIWDHLRKSTEKKVKSSIWFRLTISLVAVFFVMISGFILKGDADSIQAKRILSALLFEIPLIGKYISYSLLGSESSYQLVYVNHIATATIFIWLIIIEHVKLVWPSLKSTLYFLTIILIASFIFPAGLHNNLNPVMKGPWYFLGLQELFHYFSYPSIVIIFFTLLIILTWRIPKLSEITAKYSKQFLFFVSILYMFLIVIGYFFRGENWKFSLPWNNTYFTTFTSPVLIKFQNYFTNYDSEKELKTILNQKEGCVYCHANTKGFTSSHSPEAIGCTSCHLGNPFTIDKNLAHNSIVLIPGNLSNAHLTCGNTKCHPDIPDRVDNSIMTSMSGVVSVDKYVFGESDSLNKFYRVDEIGNSAADTHLKNLCASCHLSKMKKKYEPITQLSRGGGCVACHLNYSEKAKLDLNQFLTSKKLKGIVNDTLFHPELSLKVTNEHCFGCHSRSGRISTNYEGWHETHLNKEELNSDSTHRVLEDSRIFKFVADDVHHQKGLECIDCHNSYELMGDGEIYAHEEDQTKIQCNDCHFSSKPQTVTFDKMDYESQKIARLRGLDVKNRKYLVTAKDSIPLLNTYVDKDDSSFMIGKNSKKIFPLKPPKSICDTGEAHSTLTCNSCHTSWSPQCVGCHTEFKPDGKGINHLTGMKTDGRWIEASGIFFAEPPTLGIVKNRTKQGTALKVGTFIPGMILTVDKSKFTKINDDIIFKRLFAPTVSHTVSSSGRGCKSCHNNPLAIGYGRGNLSYNISGGKGTWKFDPEYADDENDGLPQDAWIGFLDPTKLGKSTRTNARSFNIEEQEKILTVGACLTCHKEDSNVMKRTLLNWNELLKIISDKCILPEWTK